MPLTSASKGSVKSESGLPIAQARVTMNLLGLSVTILKDHLSHDTHGMSSKAVCFGRSINDRESTAMTQGLTRADPTATLMLNVS
jgi:hypothetical protein